ncbi:Yippee-like protein [Corchorus capsularis]|uniref:Yippee-like protein n=1 Tax=Corchorus capsularis TaxID=210143 RepID=A0A1R3JE01_COCAP|nr:Yippee-like protein [Corchorus capsularis]
MFKFHHQTKVIAARADNAALKKVKSNMYPMTRFFICSSCRNPLVYYEDKLFMDADLGAIICKKAVNMRVDPEDKVLYWNLRPVVNAYCNRCNKIHGHQFLRAQTNSLTEQEGWFRLFLNKMLLWNGFEVVSADTIKPASKLVCFTVGPSK